MELSQLVSTILLGLITVFAIFRSPIIALRIQKEIEVISEARQRKINIFKTLLATRADNACMEHIQALNMIDIEYYEEKKIRESWGIYRNHLNSPGEEQFALEWDSKRQDYLANLLYEMSQYFGYEFDKVILKSGAYNPKVHGDMYSDTTKIRKGLIGLLDGNAVIKVEISKKRHPDSI